MKYCCTESDRKGTCYHEFQKGKFNGSFWDKDSILIDDDILNDLHLAELFHSVIPSYDECGQTEVSQEQWHEIYLKASKIGGEVKNAIDEIDLWTKNIFKTENVFTILGL